MKRIIWLLILVALALVAIALILGGWSSDKAGASTVTCLDDQCIIQVCQNGTCVGLGFTRAPEGTSQFIKDPVLTGAAARAGDAEAEAAYRRPCGQVNKAKDRIVTTSPLGRHFTTFFSLGWCYAHGHITWVGKLKVWGDLGSAGESLGFHWDDGGTIKRNWFRWGSNNHDDGGFAATGAGVWKQCFSNPWPLTGQTCPVHKYKYGKLLVYSDGHYDFFKPSACDLFNFGCRKS